jgi:uncharacterized membrane protein YoaK (UPF0700 family)
VDQPTYPLDSVHKAWLAFGLTWVAGFVDIVGYTFLDHILSANMSGNTVEIAFNFFHLSSAQAFARGWAVLLFVAGLFLCACIHEVCRRHGISTSGAITIGLEATFLIVLAVAGSRYEWNGSLLTQSPRMFYFLLALTCSAMGLQNATLTNIGAMTVRTTHVTGTLSKFAESGSRYLFWFYDKTRGPGQYRYREAFRLSFHHPDFQDAGITALLWIGFLGGGFCGVWLHHLWKLKCLCVPVALLVWFAFTDLVRPYTNMKQ